MAGREKSESNTWWSFTDTEGSFEARHPEQFSRLYFPICNEAGILSAITPTLHGDIKTGQNYFLTQPTSVDDLHTTRLNREFWVLKEGEKPWAFSSETAGSRLQAGPLWHRLSRTHSKAGLEVSITNFAPHTSDTVELMWIQIRNVSKKPVRFTPLVAIPIFGRSADNLRDHRHVTSLLHRIRIERNGVLVKPTMSFDERGHKMNDMTYAVLATSGQGAAPEVIYPTLSSFIGEGGTLSSPEAVRHPKTKLTLTEVELQGREAFAGLQFKPIVIPAGKSVDYIVCLGMSRQESDIKRWTSRYGKTALVAKALEGNKTYWKERLDQIRYQSGDSSFDGWTRWVTLQPMLRKIFGCSFLPDFDYGRGGRGWRDLWQDCLALLLLQPPAARSLLMNNFAGVRPEGSNATIIGKNPGEFIADRNNISRTWMDHGVWPWITTQLYLHQSGDWKILLEKVPYFLDRDKALTSSAKTGTILEHVLVQHVTSYFNVGAHGNIRLEDADWNDGLDMAHHKGESVAFTAVYAGNLLAIADTLEALALCQNLTTLSLSRELVVLLKADASSPSGKQSLLKRYQEKTHTGISGVKESISTERVVALLRQKGTHLSRQVSRKEWIRLGKAAWFNGYYDDQSRRVEGVMAGRTRMTLTGQVFPIMMGVASQEQVEKTFAAVQTHLKDKKLGGYRLNTDFGAIQPTLGRAFSFAYGEKENGAFFSHMNIMFANALYQRGFAKEGWDVLSSVQKMCENQTVGKIYPNMPEYFNGEGRGLYCYLTGSASWFVLTLVTQVCGVRGEWGDLVLDPKLMAEQCDSQSKVSLVTAFAGKTLEVHFRNPALKSYPDYQIKQVLLNGTPVDLIRQANQPPRISRKRLLAEKAQHIRLDVILM